MNAQCRMLLVLCVCLFLIGCDESDLTSIKMVCNADGSGTIRVNCAGVPGEPKAVEQACGGTQWSNRIKITSTIGEFASIADLNVAGITFELPEPTKKLQSMVVTLPRGEDALWAEIIAPATEDERAQAAAAFDEKGRLESLGDNIKIEIELPGEVVATGTMPYVKKVAASYKRNTATLTAAVDQVRTSGEAISWIFTWQR